MPSPSVLDAPTPVETETVQFNFAPSLADTATPTEQQFVTVLNTALLTGQYGPNTSTAAGAVLTNQWTEYQGSPNWGLPISKPISNIYSFAKRGPSGQKTLYAGGRYSSILAGQNKACLLKCTGDPLRDWTDITANMALPGTNINEIRCLFCTAGGVLYAGTQVGVGGQIWRSGDGGNTWTLVVPSSQTGSTISYVRNFIEFNGALYAGTVSTAGNDPILLTSTDGFTWTTVAGLTFPSHGGGAGGIYGFLVVGSTLYLTTDQWNTTPVGGVWSSPDGVTWTQLNTVALTGASSQIIHQIVSWGGYLFISTQDTTNGCGVYRSGDGGISWTAGPGAQVVTNGFGAGKSNQEVYTLAVSPSGRTLMACTYNQTLGGDIWLTSDGFNWYTLGPTGMGQPTNLYQGCLSMFPLEDRIITSTRPANNSVTYGTFPTVLYENRYFNPFNLNY